MANERIFLVWIRTSIGIMAFGFVVERFSIFVKQVSYFLGKEVNMFGLGLPEIMVVLVIALLFFGHSKLPSLGKSLGEAIRGFKKGLESESPEEKNQLNKSVIKLWC
jgi:TatA/E family protein of Tat protein translocase